METSSTVPMSSSLPSEWAQALWESVLDDQCRPLLIIDESQQILFHNKAAQTWLGIAETDNLTLTDIFSPPIANERAVYLQEALDIDRPVIVDGILLGEGLRCFNRALPPTEAHGRTVLLTFEKISSVCEQVDPHNSYRVAQFNDLGALERLTPREIEVLAMLAKGMSSNEMAAAIHRSRRTIDCHRAAISQKLGLNSHAELVMTAMRAGLTHDQSKQNNHNPQIHTQLNKDFLQLAIETKRFNAGNLTDEEHELTINQLSV